MNKHFVLVLWLCTVVFTSVQSASHADEILTNLPARLLVLSSPFAAPDGSPLAVTNIFSTTNVGGGATFSIWNSANQSFSTTARVRGGGQWAGVLTNKIARGQGFYLTVIMPNSLPMPVTFQGTLSTATVITNRYTNAGLDMLGYPFLAPVAINNLNLTGVTPYVTGHLLHVWDIYAFRYRTLFYDAGGELGGGWQDIEAPGQPSPYVLQPLEGFWLEMPAVPASVTWEASAP
jgi:hypothetical protein